LRAAQGQQPQAVIYINNALINSSAFESIHILIDNITAVAIQTTKDTKPTFIINIYNPTGNGIDWAPLRQYLRHSISVNRYNALLIVEDFNLHHPLWNRQNYHVHDRSADDLVNIMMENNMSLLLPPETTTYLRSRTTIDLTWGNKTAARSIIKCGIAEKHDHGSDHLPIQIILNLESQQVGNGLLSFYNYEETDWKGLEMKLKKYLP